MDNWMDHVMAAIRLAAADLMTKLAQVQQGWTTLTHNDPLVQQAVDLAVREATARGVPVDEIAIAGSHIMAAVGDIAASGADPAAVIAENPPVAPPEDAPPATLLEAVQPPPVEPEPVPEPEPVVEPEPVPMFKSDPVTDHPFKNDPHA